MASVRRLGELVGVLLRGVSQIFFIDNPWAGGLLLVGMGWVHPWVALVVATGALGQTVGAWALLGKDAVRTGMMGYNGALVGAAAAAALGAPLPALLMTVVGALACVPVHAILQRVLGCRALEWVRLPVATAPFCLVAGVLFDLVLPLVHPGTTSTGEGAAGAVLGAFNNFSEVVLADGLVPGLLILAALFVGGVRTGLFGVLGSLVALAGALLVGDGVAHVSSGLLGYSAVLVAIALGAVLWNDKPLWARLTGAVVGAALTLAMQPLLALLPLPVYTWPFLLSLWLVMLGVAAVTRRRRAGGDTPMRTAPAPTQ
ncbi:urea transporter [Kocuria tytonicola]|uniref:Urea transporter n=1 Tax=Kocuria tytonicola TaxID=2055946 RepID=A0A3L9L4N2_9MICC|nr:urea transporter [Kocuria tytonicola]RLY93740.1 urea transporter [Kocuria tytonicola]